MARYYFNKRRLISRLTYMPIIIIGNYSAHIPIILPIIFIIFRSSFIIFEDLG